LKHLIEIVKLVDLCRYLDFIFIQISLSSGPNRPRDPFSSLTVGIQMALITEESFDRFESFFILTSTHSILEIFDVRKNVGEIFVKTIGIFLMPEKRIEVRFWIVI